MVWWGEAHPCLVDVLDSLEQVKLDATVHKIDPLSASGMLGKNERMKNDRLQHHLAIFLLC